LRGVIQGQAAMISAEERREAEEEFRKLADVLPQYMCAYAADGTPLYASDTLLDYFGFTLQDFRSDDFHARAFHPDDVERAQRLRQDAMSRGEGWEVEARILRKDGKYRWFLIRGKPLRGEDGRVLRWFSSGTDIDDRKQAQLELQQLVDAVPQHIVVLSRDGKRLYGNQAACEYHGLSPQRFLVEPITNCFHLDDIENYSRRRNSGIAKEEPWEAEARLRRKNGAFRWFLIRGKPLRNEQGLVMRWYLTRTDIEERKVAELELRRLIDAVPQYIRVDDKDGKVLYANDRLLDYFGMTLEEVQASDFRTRVCHPDDLDRVRSAREDAFSRGVGWEVEARIRRKDGEYRWFLNRYNPLRDEQGQIVRWYAAGTDIEDRKQAEREIQQLVDAVPQLILVLAADGSRLYANKVVLDFHGCTLKEFLDQKTSYQRVHPSDLAGYLDVRRRGISSGHPFQTEIRLLSKSGEYRWFLVQFNPSQDEQGRVARWYATATDIQDRKQAEEALRRSETYLAEAQRLSHTGSWAWDVARKEITHWSTETYRAFGFDPSGGPVTWAQARSRIHPEDLQGFEENKERVANEKAELEFDFRLVHSDGSIRHAHCVSRPVLDASGEVIELVGSIMDVTEQHKAKAALEAAFEEIKRLKDELYRENLVLKEEIDQASMFEEIVGTSDALRRVLVQVAKVAPTNSTVLLIGETGTGKELVARAIHKRSQRAPKTFVSVNCAAIPAGLIASELFGHEKGAFTGATQRHLGRFELADGGTLFLDEVGDLPSETQVALLRVLQERRLERVGGTQSITVDVRIIAATNRDLKAAVNSGTFRSDLFYRLNVFPIVIPPLRDRKDDLPLLLEYLTERYASKAGKKIKKIDRRAFELFQTYDWPGNVRELQNIIERAVILCDGETLSVDESWLQSESTTRTDADRRLARPGPEQERKLIEAALAESRGRIAGPSGAAAKLGIPRSTLETKIRKLGIPKYRFKSA
jgi:PAS domain S-box-containing protein